MQLIIAEKPSLAQAIAAILPGKKEKKSGYIEAGNIRVTWCVGHILEQAMPDYYLPESVPKNSKGNKIWRFEDLPIVPKEWHLQPIASMKGQLKVIQSLLKDCDEVVHAGDAGPEGQLLVDEVLHYCHNRKPVKRIKINDNNEDKVRLAWQQLESNTAEQFQGWYRFALARSRYDWLFGLNLTRAYTLRGRALGHSGVLSAGSVQTPTLKIVVDRDLDIENFQSKPYFTLQGTFFHHNGSFIAHWTAKTGQTGLDKEDRLIDPAVAKRLAEATSDASGVITEYQKTTKEEAPPLLFSLGALQMEANDRFGYSAKQTLDLAQSLYETHKLITYPRTDCAYVGEDRHHEAKTILAAIQQSFPELTTLIEKADPQRKSSAFNDQKVGEHHAILPTGKALSLDRLTAPEKEIYRLICLTYLAQFHGPAVYLTTKINLQIAAEEWRANSRTLVFPGWKILFGKKEDETSAEDSEIGSLPAVAVGDTTKCTAVAIKQKQTTPPARHTEKSILVAMENIYRYVTHPEAKKRLKDGDGIGTSATRAAIIEELKNKQYLIPVKTGSKQIMSSQVARELIAALPMEVKDPGIAGLFKLKLDEVQKGTTTVDAFLQDTVSTISTLIEQAKTLSIQVPATAKKSEESTVPCPTCQTGKLRKIKGSKGEFWACSNYKNETTPCKATFPDKGNQPDTAQKANSETVACPTCGSGQLRRLPSKKDPKKFFWSCSNYRNTEQQCTAIFFDKAGKPDFSSKEKRVA